MKSGILLSVIVSIFLLGTVAHAQTLGDTPGVEFYRKGDFARAIELLKTGEDVVSLHYLGLSYEKTDKIKDAKGAFERSFKVGFALVETKLDEKRGPASDATLGAFSEFLKTIEPLLSLSIESARHAVRLKSNIRTNEEWMVKVNSLLQLSDLAKSDHPIYSGIEVDSRIKILKKPRANSPTNGPIPGTVRLLIVYGLDGKVRSIISMKPVKGLTNEAIKAAKQITFEPATKNGKPVTSIAWSEYIFSIG